MKMLAAAVCSLSALTWAGLAQAASETPFTIIVGDEAFLSEASIMAKAMDHENGLRILPVVGTGSVQALRDLQAFPQFDAALVTSDILGYIKAQNLLAPGENKLSYVAAVKTLPIYLVARRGVLNVTGLAGKKIVTGPADSAAFAAGELLLGALEVPFLRVPSAAQSGVESLLQGKADAALFVGIPHDLDRLGLNFHLIPLAMPGSMATSYQLIKLSAKDVPGLVPQGKEVESVATQLVIAVSDASDIRKSRNAFEDEFFRQHSNDSMPGEVPGWRQDARAAGLVKSRQAQTFDPQATIQPAGAKP